MKLSKERKAIILAGVLISGGGQGVIINTLSIFIKPVTEAMGFARGGFTLYSSIVSLVAVLTLPLYGEVYRKKWFPKFMVLSAVIFAAIPLGYSFCTNLLSFYLLSVILGLVFHGTSITAVANVLNRWFGRNKGVATGICFAGSGAFAAIMLRIGNSIIRDYGWNWGYRFISVCSFFLLATGALIVWWLESHDRVPGPEDPEFQVEISGHSDVELTRSEALRTVSFWGLLLATAIVSFVAQAGGSSIAAYLSDIGYSVEFQGSLASASMLALAFGKILVGKLLDRAGLRLGFAVTTLAMLLYAVSLLTMTQAVSPYLYVICYSVAASGSTVLASCSTATCFGRKEYSRIYVLVSIALNLGVAAGNWVPGAIFDSARSYMPAWVLLLVLAVVNGVLYAAIYLDHRKRSLAAAGQR